MTITGSAPIFSFKFRSGSFQLPQGLGSGVPIHIFAISEDGIRKAPAVSQGLFPKAPSGGAHHCNRLIDQPHAGNRNRIIMRRSSVSRETPLKDAIAELCAQRQKGP